MDYVRKLIKILPAHEIGFKVADQCLPKINILSLGIPVVITCCLFAALPSSIVTAQTSYNIDYGVMDSHAYMIDSTDNSEEFTKLNLLQRSTSHTSIQISEINYAGSYNPNCNACAYDKWIELYNPTSLPVSLDGYSLRFKNSLDSNLNLSLKGGSIAPYSYYLISNLRSGMESMLSQAGVNPDMVSGKVLSVSNNQTKTVELSLIYSANTSYENSPNSINPLGETLIDRVRIDSQQLVSLEASGSGYKHSLERINGQWALSKSMYAPNNFGSPLGFFLPSEQATSNTSVNPALAVSSSNPTLSKSLQPVTTVADEQNANLNNVFEPETNFKNAFDVETNIGLSFQESKKPLSRSSFEQIPKSELVAKQRQAIHSVEYPESVNPIPSLNPLHHRFYVTTLQLSPLHIQLSKLNINPSRFMYSHAATFDETRKIGISYADQILILAVVALYSLVKRGKMSENWDWEFVGNGITYLISNVTDRRMSYSI